MEHLVAITYIQDGAQGNELALSIEGWRKHFKEPHRILVVGDMPTVNDVEWIPVVRVPEMDGEYRPALDICKKLDTICAYCLDRGYDNFIWASDDFFAVNNFTLEDVLAPKYLADELPSKGDNHPNHFWRTQVKTRRLCERRGYGVMNWTTHLPMWFSAARLSALIGEYRMTEKAYIVENIYYNKYIPFVRPSKLARNDRWKHEVCFTPFDREGFRNALKNKIWVSCSVNGWCDELEIELKNHYKQCQSTQSTK